MVDWTAASKDVTKAAKLVVQMVEWTAERKDVTTADMWVVATAA